MRFSPEEIWAQFQPREESALPAPRAPEAEFVAVLESAHAAATEIATDADARERKWLDTLGELGALAYRTEMAHEEHRESLGGHAGDHVRLLHKQLMDVFAATGVSMPNLNGWKYKLVSELVVVDSWRHGDEFAEEVVAEVIEAPVVHGDRVLRLGRVVMGSPREATETHQEEV